MIIRRLLASLSGAALVTAVGIYVASFDGLMLDQMGFWPFGLHLGFFALILPMSVIEYSSIREQSFYWKGFAFGKPTWVVPTIKILGIFFFVHFVLFLVHSHAAAPEIVKGQFVLNDHGTIKKVITEREYLRLKGDELRLFATGWMFMYVLTATYWWFPRKPLPLNPYD